MWGTVPPATAPLPGMLGAPLVGYQVVQMGQPSQQRLWAPVGMMEALHREQLPLDGVMGLIQAEPDRASGLGTVEAQDVQLLQRPRAHAAAAGDTLP